MEKRILFLMVLFVVFLNPVSAIDFKISPAETQRTASEWGGEGLESRISISVKNQNSLADMTCTLYQNNADVDEETIANGNTKDLHAGPINIPSQGTGIEEIDFEVYCKDSLGVSDSKSTSFIVLYPLNPYFDLDASAQKTTLGWGESTQGEIEISNNNDNFGLDCTISKDGSLISSVSIGEQRTSHVSYSITAPESGSDIYDVEISAQCQSTYNGDAAGSEYETTKTEAISIEYPIQEQSNAKSEIDEAESSVKDASSSIKDAENKISEANDVGATLTQPQSDLEDAKSDLDEANSYLSQAEDSFDLGSYQEASSKASDAQDTARSAETSAENAESGASDAIQNIKDNSRVKISEAERKLEELRTAIDELNSQIETARGNGLNVNEEEQKLENYRSLSSEVELSLDEARTSVDNSNYGNALSKAQNVLDDINSGLDNAESTVNSLGGSIPDSGESNVATSIERAVKDLLRSDQDVSQETADLTANNFERKDIAITKSTGTSYSVEMIYSHPSGETFTLSSIVNTAEDKVSGVSMPGIPSKVNQNWEESQSAQETRNSILLIAGVAISLIIAGAFAYYFVNPVNKTVNNFVGDDESESSSSSSGSEFSCPSCGAPVTPDILEDGECPYCSSTVSPS